MAWIADNRNQDRKENCSCYSQVHILDRSGERMAASGTEIVAGSLVLHDGRVYWTQAGRVSSAVLNRGAKPPAPRQAGRCAPVEPFVFTSDERAQLFREAEDFNGPQEIFGCAYGHAHTVSLGLDAEFAGVGGFPETGQISNPAYALAGTVVGYQQYPDKAELAGLERRHLIARDLVTGRVLERVAATPPEERLPKPETGVPQRVYASTDGAIAWETRNPLLEAHLGVGYFEIAIAKHGHKRVVARGRNIDERSLLLVGDTLYWSERDGSHSIRMP